MTVILPLQILNRRDFTKTFKTFVHESQELLLVLLKLISNWINIQLTDKTFTVVTNIVYWGDCFQFRMTYEPAWNTIIIVLISRNFFPALWWLMTFVESQRSHTASRKLQVIKYTRKIVLKSLQWPMVSLFQKNENSLKSSWSICT